MIALLIADSEDYISPLSTLLEGWAFDVIRYRSAIKALDNLEEISPDAVIISAKDFPRHWKALVQYIRSDSSRSETVIALVVNERFSSEEADKASFIGVQAIIREDIESDKDKLLDIFSRYRYVGKAPSRRVFEITREQTEFLFTNPKSGVIITGRLDSIDTQSLVFKCDCPSETSDLVIGDLIDRCSLKIQEKFFTPRCTVTKNGSLIELSFDEPSADLVATIQDLLED